MRDLRTRPDQAVELILGESMREAHRLGALTTPAFGAFVAVAIGVLFGWEAGHLLWGSALAASGIGHWIASRSDVASSKWLRMSVAAQVLDGIAWGSLLLFLAPDDATGQALILSGLLSLPSTQIAASASIKLSAYAFFATQFLVVSGSAAVTASGYLRWAFIPALVTTGFAIYMTNAVHRDRLDVTRMTLKLEQQAATDPLTGLLNRRAFSASVVDQLQHAGAAQVGFIDLDKFKAVNDSHGHDTGDELLTLVARRLLAREASFFAAGRIGGDEFAVLAQAVGDPLEFGATILEVFREPFVLSGVTVQLGCSVGVSSAEVDASAEPTESDPVFALLQAADQAQMRSKHAGGTAVNVASPITFPPVLEPVHESI